MSSWKLKRKQRVEFSTPISTFNDMLKWHDPHMICRSLDLHICPMNLDEHWLHNINHNTFVIFYYFRFHTNISIKINTHASHHHFSWFVSAYFKLSFLVTTAMLEALVWTGPFFIVHISFLTLTKDTKFGDIWPTC